MHQGGGILNDVLVQQKAAIAVITNASTNADRIVTA
jgi:hypothetical protein